MCFSSSELARGLKGSSGVASMTTASSYMGDTEDKGRTNVTLLKFFVSKVN